LRALGEETVGELADTVEKVTGMVDEQALEDMKSSFNAMAESDIPEDVKNKIADRTGKIWDDLSHDDKTRELAATLVRNISCTAGDSRIVALREQEP